MNKNVRLDKILQACGDKIESLLHPLTPEKNADPFLTGIAVDSRAVQPGNIYIALKGAAHNGENYIPAAVKRGASTVMATPNACKEFQIDFPDTRFIATESPRHLVSPLASLFFPKQPAHIAAVTGTNGKTSVADFCRQFWEHLGLKSASIGTLGITPALDQKGLALTTPDPIYLHQSLEELAEKGVDYLSLEASSHGLEQHRLDGVDVSAAAFTNLSHDHLDYHKDAQHYLAAKTRLFSEILCPTGIAVLNADVPEFNILKQAAGNRRIVTYGKSGHDLQLNYLEALPDGQKVSLTLFGKQHHLLIPLVGRFQVINILCSLGLVNATLGSEKLLEDLVEFIPCIQNVPGRMQLIGKKNGGAPVFVDYAHTPAALQTILQVARHHAQGKIHVIFGCGGNRDQEKRAIMGEISEQFADHIIVTDDNPRYEDPKKIRQDILTNCTRAHEIGDRKEAIHTGIKKLRSGDILIIAGKGHEQGQKVGNTMLPFDDAKVAREILEDLQ